MGTGMGMLQLQHGAGITAGGQAAGEREHGLQQWAGSSLKDESVRSMSPVSDV